MNRKPNNGSFKPGLKRGPRPEWVKVKISESLKKYIRPKDIRTMRNILTGVREYRKLKTIHLRNHPNCYICDKKANNAHHIIPLNYSLSGTKALKQIRNLHIPTNLLSVCNSCHSKIHFHHGERKYFVNTKNRFKPGYDIRRFTNKYQAVG